MTKDEMIENSNYEFEKFKEEQIKEWVENGACITDAEQLFEDMINDVNYPDPDMIAFSDFTINERIERYSTKK